MSAAATGGISTARLTSATTDMLRADDRSATGNVAVAAAAAVVIGVAFFAADHDPAMSTLEGFAYTTDQLTALTHGGNVVRQSAYLSLAGLGFCLLLAARKRPWQPDGLLFPLVGAFVGWSVASLAWSIDPGITARRLFVFGCCLLAAAGTVRQLRARQIVQLACVVSTSYLVVGVATELMHGTFRPWAGEYRFAGTLHPNAQGMNLAVVCLSSCSLLREARRGRLVLAAVLTAGLLFLLLMRSRTATAGAMLGLAAIWGLRTSLPRICVQSVFVLAAALSCAFATAGLGGSATSARLERAVFLGRAEHTGSLTGRVPLWNELLRYAVQRPLTGCGYDTFWTETHIRQVSASQSWAIHEAHSTYMELLLALGIPGLLIAVTAAAIAAAASAVHYRRSGESAYGFFLGLYLFAFVDAGTESGMLMPNFVPFMAGCGVLMLATSLPSAAPRRMPDAWRGSGSDGRLTPRSCGETENVRV